MSGQRLRITQVVRAVTAVFVLALALAGPGLLAGGAADVREVTAGYLVVILLAQWVGWTFPQRRGGLFTALLVVDALWWSWCCAVSGGPASSLRPGVILQVAVVALMTSRRISAVVAAAQSVLLVDWDLARPGTGHGLGGREAVFLAVLWLVVTALGSLSALNETELRRQRDDLAALTGLAVDLEHASDSTSVARILLDTAMLTPAFRRGLVVAGADGHLRVLASVGLPVREAGRPDVLGSSAVLEQAERCRATRQVAGVDPRDDPGLHRLLPAASALVVVPLTAEGRSLGALVLERAPGQPPVAARAVEGLERSAAYAALALRNAWLLEQVQRLAATDGLTQLPNRRTFEATLGRELARSARTGAPVGLVMIDIDHFKRLNDEHGHQAGDEVLRAVGAALAGVCRDLDTPARFGGEEFAVVLPGCDTAKALDIAERLRRAVAAAPVPWQVTASAGVASFPAHGCDADRLVRAADHALYRSKEGGRARTTCAGPLDLRDALRLAPSSTLSR